MSQETKTSLRPLGDRVVVKRLEEDTHLKGGIILPDSAKKKQEKAQVIALGNGKIGANGERIPMPVKVGDIVLMDQYAGQEITVDNEEYIVLRADELIATVQQ